MTGKRVKLVAKTPGLFRDRVNCLDNRYVALLYRYVRYRGEK
jgi:hypothetical protein